MAAAIAATILALTACSSSTDGAKTSCDLNKCKITFDRGVDATASVLGIEVKFVGVKDEKATVSVAGQEVSMPVSQQTEVAGFKVTVQNVTDKEAVIEVARP